MGTTKYKLFGWTIWTVVTDEKDDHDRVDDLSSRSEPVGFVRTDLPTWHKPGTEED